ncbi:SDR family oxidoreductase [Nocardia tengchongensis]|uniref:SDR family oxidoreductase n=1 Tax=Nocardia tengchongensis TaxID=2055889 RepID=UPI003681D7E0
MSGVFSESSSSSYVVYSTAKIAVVDLAVSLAVELGSEGIRVNALVPGLMRTARVVATAKANGIGANDRDARASLARLGTLDDKVGAIQFFATDLSTCITGELVTVDSGVHQVSVL